MEKPIYNQQERWEIREFDNTLNAFKKLNLAILHFRRDMERSLYKTFKIGI